MPTGSPFRHQIYRSLPPTSPYRVIPSARYSRSSSADARERDAPQSVPRERIVSQGDPATQAECVDPHDARFAQRLADAGRRFSACGVVQTLCLHGTFAGNDPLGLVTLLARPAPQACERLGALVKRGFDALVGETGNYTADYCARMERGLSAGAGRLLPVSRFHWSGQNNHIARADAAVRLIVRLAELAKSLPSSAWRENPTPRVLLWGHSHGGNVLALLTQLLGTDDDGRKKFFEAARVFFAGANEPPYFADWRRCAVTLGDPEHPVRRLKIDIATFGTPIRYAWDDQGCAGLVHFIHHRLFPDQPVHLMPSLSQAWRFLWDPPGDFVHQVGIAGTNFPPCPLLWRAYLADRRLHRLLEYDLADQRWLTRWSSRMRVPSGGRTLLVDYRDRARNLATSLAGHAVYTRSRWMLWHCEQVAEAIYA